MNLGILENFLISKTGTNLFINLNIKNHRAMSVGV